MGGDFNCRHRSWDPRGPASNVHADRLESAASRLGLSCGMPVVVGPTHFPYNPLLKPTVINLVYIPEELLLRVHHSIHLDIRGSSDHAPLLTELPTPGFEVNRFKSYLKPDMPEYTSWMDSVRHGSGKPGGYMDTGPTGTDTDDHFCQLHHICTHIHQTRTRHCGFGLERHQEQTWELNQTFTSPNS